MRTLWICIKILHLYVLIITYTLPDARKRNFADGFQGRVPLIHTGNHRWPGFTGQPTTSLTLWSPAHSVETVHQSGVATGWTPTRTHQLVYGLEFDQSCSSDSEPLPRPPINPCGLSISLQGRERPSRSDYEREGEKGAAPLAGVNRKVATKRLLFPNKVRSLDARL